MSYDGPPDTACYPQPKTHFATGVSLVSGTGQCAPVPDSLMARVSRLEAANAELQAKVARLDAIVIGNG